LGLRENGSNLFAVYTPPPEPAAVPIVEEPTEEPVAETIETPVVQHSDIDPATMTVAQIKALTLTPEQWRLLAIMERSGKNRVSVLEYADAQAG